MKLTLPTVYSQFDDKWAKIVLGNNTDPKFDIYNFGCLLSSLATVLTYYGKNETPFTLNDKLKAKEVGGFQEKSGIYNHGSITKLYPDVTERAVVTPNLLTDDQVKEIKGALDAGNPVIFKIDYNPKTVAINTHFVTAVGYNPKDENDFLIADPLGGVTKSLKSYLGWLKPNARKSIEKYMILSGPVPQVKVEEPAPTPAAPVAEPVAPQPSPAPETQPQVEPVAAPVTEAAPVVEPGQLTPFGVLEEKWARLVEYLEIGKEPKDATFEDAKRVIAGHKSAKTDYSNKMTAALTKAAEAETTITNLKGDIEKLKQEIERSAKLHKAELDALNTNRPSLEKYQEQVKAVTNEMQGKLNEANETIKQLRLDKAKLEAEEEAEAGVSAVVDERGVDIESKTAPKKPSIWKRLLWLHW